MRRDYTDALFEFQSTRPRGARRLSADACPLSWMFQSTRPRGARRSMDTQLRLAGRFQSTRPRGARRGRPPASPRRNRFNPRAREGRDALVPPARRQGHAFQSTRPRGARPASGEGPGTAQTVSIHAPARGATDCVRKARLRLRGFNPRAREGRDSSSMHSHRIEPIALYRKSLPADSPALTTSIQRANPARTSLGNLQSLRFARDFWGRTA